MSTRRLVGLAFTAIFAGALRGHVRTEGPGPTLVVSLERTACFGACPQYSVSLYRDGIVAYEGVRFVKVRGKRMARLTPEEAAARHSREW